MTCAISDTDRTSQCEPLVLAHTSQKYISTDLKGYIHVCSRVFKSKRVLLKLWSNISPRYWLWQYFLYLKQPASPPPSLPGLLQLGLKRKKWLTTPLILDLKNSSVSWPCKAGGEKLFFHDRLPSPHEQTAHNNALYYSIFSTTEFELLHDSTPGTLTRFC